MNSQEAIEVALRHHVAGQLGQAEAIYRQVLEREPNNPNALHLLGMLAHQTGHHEAAVALISQAIGINPSASQYHNNLGEVCRAMGRFNEAVACYARAISLKPDYAEAHFNLGNALRDAGRTEEAIAAFGKAIELKPDQPQSYNNLGSALEVQGRFDEAIAAYREANRLQPDGPEVLHNLANALRGKGLIEEAVATYRKAIILRPDFAEAYNNLGLMLREGGRPEEAMAAFIQAINIRPDFVEAHNNLGVMLREAGRLDKAILAFRAALRYKADFAQAHDNLGRALSERGLPDEAIAALNKAIELAPDYAEAYTDLSAALLEKGDCEGAISVQRKAVERRPGQADAYNNLGVVLQESGRIDEAITAYGKAAELKADLAEAHLNRALLLLLKGDYAAGWAEYEWRWRYKGFETPQRDFTQPQWRGEDPTGQTILLHAEQGFGDTIQLIRYAPLLARRGARVIVECPVELRALVQRVEGVAEAVVSGDPLPAFDQHVPMLSLPPAFGTTIETVPSAVPYVKADPGKAGTWHWKLAPEEGALRVGLAWAGNPADQGARRGSVALAMLAPLAEAKGVVFYSLQKGGGAEQAQNPPAGMNLVDLTREMKTFDDTAALIANLDLVITVETAVAHLAGAMARPVWTLLPSVPAWRWMLGREDSPWYPTMRLIRQPARGDWDSVVKRVAGELKKRVQGSGFRVR